MAREILRISNELEFGTHGINAETVLKRLGKHLDISKEVNPRDCVELRVSMASDLKELNRRLRDDTLILSDAVDRLGGRLYGGGSIITDTSTIDPVWHRTTALSEKCGRGFLNIMSQQITIGVNNEYLGLELYNFYRRINPVILAISASSPYRYESDLHISDTEYQSGRIARYSRLLAYFPIDMLEAPELESKRGYLPIVKSLSSEIKMMVNDGRLDSNRYELMKERENNGMTYRHWPFENLEPHQIFWFTRPRPDFENEEYRFVIELRVPDTPTRINNAQMINQFVIGLAYYIAKNGSHSIKIPFEGTYPELLEVSRQGMSTIINGTEVREMVERLSDYAVQGIRGEEYKDEARNFGANISNLLNMGNDSERIRAHVGDSMEKITPAELIEHLAGELRI